MAECIKISSTVCIIGAGPAGTYAAIMLAKKGIPSLLIDKAVFPRDKVCGEALTSAVLRSLQKLDANILANVEYLAAREVIKGVNLYAPNGKSFYLPFHSQANKDRGLDSSVGIRRLDLDNLLMKYAKKEALVTVKEGVDIQVVERKEGKLVLWNKEKNLQIETEMLVVANGFGSKFTRKLVAWDWESEVDACGITAFYRNVEGLSKGDVAECYILEELKSGGMYVMPVGNGVINVNIAVRSDVQKKYHLNLREIMQNALETHPALKQRFQNAEQIRKPLGCGFHLGIKKRPVSGDNFVLLGDAAAFNDALTANGIGHAMISAEIAANEIEKCYAQKNFTAAQLKNYDKAAYASFHSKRMMGFLSSPFLLQTRLFFFLVNTFFLLNVSSEVLGMILYAKYPWRLLFNPTFYYTLFQAIFPQKRYTLNHEQ
ncbi:MAG: NAD(P)/FAD-dependent oxidoreductase [Bacteroidia bacterium]